MNGVKRGRWLAAAGAAALVCGGSAFAQATGQGEPADGMVDTLREALVKTYDTNPTIMAQRQSLRATDEDAALARAAGRPAMSVTATYGEDLTTRNIVGGTGRDLNVSSTVSVPIFSGGRIRNNVRAADIRVDAGRSDLRATEGDIFTEAVAAYMDVIRDRSIVQLNENQVRVLTTNLQATRDRFEVGDLTRTDVAQSDARLALARSTLALVQGRLRASEENYERVIGVPPGNLQPPPPLPTLPGTAELATDVALANNGDLAAIAARARAADYDVRVAQGGRLPTLSGSATARYLDLLGTGVGGTNGLGIQQDNNGSTSVGLSLTMPIYQGGAAGARVRRAEAVRGQLIEQAIGVERAVVSSSAAAFASYRASLEAIESNQIAVAANQLALEGTRAEQTVGTRNVLDVLNAEQELLNSQVLLVTARRDAYVAGFQLLNVMGAAEAEDLNLDGGPLYDPIANYNRYARSWSDWDDGPMIRPVATRTAPEQAASPLTPVVNSVTRPRQ
ncbi:TolC family outer membrane protein [Sphingosinicella sp.]|uniref:TolC family outer membrane protein n=1 Tax=Sphingosinicella sp. TaxID=1917971 RepID=UPI0040381E2D